MPRAWSSSRATSWWCANCTSCREKRGSIAKMHPVEQTQQPAAEADARGSPASPDEGHDQQDHGALDPRSAAVFRVLARPLWILAICALILVLRQTRQALIPLVL